MKSCLEFINFCGLLSRLTLFYSWGGYMNARNIEEGKIWDSIDALAEELRQVFIKGAEIVDVYDIHEYFDKLLHTIVLDALRVEEARKNGKQNNN